MARYSSERKEAVLKKLLPPCNMTITEISEQEGISAQTLYNWRNTAFLDLISLALGQINIGFVKK